MDAILITAVSVGALLLLAVMVAVIWRFGAGPPDKTKPTQDPVVTLTFRGEVLQMSGPGALSDEEFFARLDAAMDGPAGEPARAVWNRK